MLGEGVVAWAAVRLSVEETLALLWTLLESVPLELPLCPCETTAAVRIYRILQGRNNSNFYSQGNYQSGSQKGNPKHA